MSRLHLELLGPWFKLPNGKFGDWEQLMQAERRQQMGGFNLPPGCSVSDIPGNGPEGPCEVCGMPEEECLCPECEICGSYGDFRCYEGVIDPNGCTVRKCAAKQAKEYNFPDPLVMTREQKLGHAMMLNTRVVHLLSEDFMFFDLIAGESYIKGSGNPEDVKDADNNLDKMIARYKSYLNPSR